METPLPYLGNVRTVTGVLALLVFLYWDRFDHSSPSTTKRENGGLRTTDATWAWAFSTRG